MVLERVGEHRAVGEQREEAARELLPPADEVIRPQLVDGDHYDELGAWGRGTRGARGRRQTEGEHDWGEHGHKLVPVRQWPPPGSGAARGRRAGRPRRTT